VGGGGVGEMWAEGGDNNRRVKGGGLGGARGGGKYCGRGKGCRGRRKEKM